MSAAAKMKVTPEEYLALERLAAFKSEYFRGEIFAMSGASFEHTLVKDNLAHEMRNCLKGGPCRVLTSDLRVKVEGAGMYAYPDVVVVCEEPKFEDKYFDTLLNPKIIVEVLSDSTEKYDRGGKFRNYQGLPTFEEYLLVSQDQPLVERFVRQPDDSWLLSAFSGLDAEMVCHSLSVRIPLADVYTGVTFPPAAAAP